jgi:hypothetical protein
MSAPASTQPARNNPNTFVLGGAIAGIVVLCAGLLTSSLITLNIVTRHAAFAFSTQRRMEQETREGPRETQPEGPSGSGEEEDNGPGLAAQGFVNDVKARTSDRYQKAWNRGTEAFKRDESAQRFRQRLEQDQGFAQHRAVSFRRVEEATKSGFVKYDVFFRGGPAGESRWVLDLRREDDSWRIDSFTKPE